MKTKLLIGLMVLLAGNVIAVADYPETRVYLLGDKDGIHYDGAGSVDDVYVDPALIAHLQAVAPAETNDHFDVLHANNNVPFTFLFPLGPDEHVIAASLTLGLQAVDSLYYTDWLVIRGTDVRTGWIYTFPDLGWSPLSFSSVSQHTVDLDNILGDNRLDLLQHGKFDAHITDDTAVDYAELTITVTPEPATLSLLALGGLALLRRRRGR